MKGRQGQTDAQYTVYGVSSNTPKHDASNKAGTSNIPYTQAGTLLDQPQASMQCAMHVYTVCQHMCPCMCQCVHPAQTHCMQQASFW
mmetsp:Transcript_17061/g.29634  ORF Transcript_17061/g.29634 Transcript_17061/m.29634 type:complete len:87 (+) Transcript_17061:15-275(+)